MSGRLCWPIYAKSLIDKGRLAKTCTRSNFSVQCCCFCLFVCLFVFGCFFVLFLFFFLAILAIGGPMGHGIRWQRAVYFGPVEQLMEKDEGITQHVRIHTTRTCTAYSPSLLFTIYSLCYVQC